MFTSEHKLKKVEISQTILTRFQAKPENNHHRLITQDKTWVHHFEPKLKIQSKQRKHSDSPQPKKFKQVASVVKMVASVLVGSESVIMID